MKHINLTNWRGSITDWTKLNYIYGGLDDSYAVKGNLRIDKDNYNYVEYRESNNQLPLDDVEEAIINGITYKIENGAIYLDGTANARVQLYFNTSVKKGTISINYFNDFTLAGGKMSLNFRDSEQNLLFYINSYPTTNITRTNTIAEDIGELYINIVANTTLNNVVLKPMIVSGSTAPSIYEPYFEGKKYVITENLGIVDLGTYTYTAYSGNIFSTPTIANAKKPASNNDNANISCIKYTSTNATAIWTGFDKGIAINTSGQCQIKDTAYTDAPTFKTAMSGVMLIYELATPKIEVVE